MRGRFLLIALLLSLPAAAGAVEPLGFATVEVAPGVLAFIQDEPGVGNSVAIITDTDVIVVDSTVSPFGSRAIIEAIRARTSKPVRYLVNTHWHDDHIWGNQELLAAYPGVEIVSQHHTREDIASRAVPGLANQIAQLEQGIARREAMVQEGVDEEGAPLGEERTKKLEGRLEVFRKFIAEARTIRPALPTLTFEDRFVLTRGDETIEILHVGRGHTRGDVVVHLPERRVLITGDLLTHPFPAATEAFPVEWIDAMGRVEALDYDVLVPGHGPVMRDREFLRDVTRLLESVVSQVEEAVARGLSLEATIESVELGDLRGRFFGKTPGDERAFDRWFLDPAIRSAFATLMATPSAGSSQARPATFHP